MAARLGIAWGFRSVLQRCDLRRKLINLGLHRQAILTILRKAPLNGPWQLQVDKTSFSIRPHYIADIHVGLVE
jgi:Fe2+ transport system protein FeoA